MSSIEIPLISPAALPVPRPFLFPLVYEVFDTPELEYCVRLEKSTLTPPESVAGTYFVNVLSRFPDSVT